MLWALTSEEKVIASVRTTWFNPNDPYSIPEMKAYSDDISANVPASCRILSGNRLVTDPDLSAVTPQLVLVLLRHYMVIAHQKADWAIAAVRVNHVPFYRRVLNLEKVSDGRTYPGLRCAMHLLACDFRKNIATVVEKTPLLKPRGYERIFLDDNYEDVWETGVPVET